MKKSTMFSRYTVGLDVGDRTSRLCALDREGGVVHEAGFRTEATALEAALERWPGCRVILEVGGQSPWMSWQLEALGHEVIVANSYQVGQLYKGQDKSDRRDAETLARLGRADPKLLKPIRHRGAQTMADRALLRSREVLVRSRVQLVNHARGLVKTVGARLPSTGTDRFARRVREQVPASLRTALDPILDTIQELSDRIRAYDREIARVTKERYPETALFEPIRGVGPLTSLAFVLSIDDPSRFEDSRDVGSFVGLRPRRRQSGGDDPQLSITRAGDPQLRRLLVQCAHYILGPFGGDCDLRRFGERLIARGGRAAKKRAIVAVARKLSIVMHHLWVTGEVYDPLNIILYPETTIGIDLGDRYSHGCVLNLHGEVLERFRFETTRAGLEKAFRDRPLARVVVEVGTHSPWVSRDLQDLGHEVLVANAREVQSISKSDRKNDAADAEQLARLGRADPKLLHPIQHRREDTQRDRALLAVRDKIVRTRASLVVQAGGLAKGLGERLPKSTPWTLPRRVREAGLEELFPGLSSLLEVVETLSTQIRALDRQIEQLSKGRYPETALLRQVGGVGPITSLAYVLTIEDPHRFARSRSVGVYLGMRPRQRDSGERSPQLSISKAGDRYLRGLLVEGAQYIMTIGPDCDLRRYGERIVQRGGPAVRKRAVVAVARKLAVLLHSLWRTAEVYEPLRQARIGESAAA